MFCKFLDEGRGGNKNKNKFADNLVLIKLKLFCSKMHV